MSDKWLTLYPNPCPILPCVWVCIKKGDGICKKKQRIMYLCKSQNKASHHSGTQYCHTIIDTHTQPRNICHRHRENSAFLLCTRSVRSHSNRDKMLHLTVIHRNAFCGDSDSCCQTYQCKKFTQRHRIVLNSKPSLHFSFTSRLYVHDLLTQMDLYVWVFLISLCSCNHERIFFTTCYLFF